MFKCSVKYLKYLFRPILINGRWVWFIFPLIFAPVVFQNTIAFIHEIPEKNELVKISGKFYFGDYYSRSGVHTVEMVDKVGGKYKCNCEILGRFDCFNEISLKNEIITSNVDKTYEEKYGLNRAVLKWLNGKDGEVMAWSQKGILLDMNTCFQISFNDQIIRGYDQSAMEYQGFRKSFGTITSVVLITVYLIIFIAYFVYKTYKFLKSEGHGCK